MKFNLKAKTLPLTEEQIAYLERPRWELDPPQREEYTDEHSYMIAMDKYAQRCLEAELLERIGKPVSYDCEYWTSRKRYGSGYTEHRPCGHCKRCTLSIDPRMR